MQHLIEKTAEGLNEIFESEKSKALKETGADKDKAVSNCIEISKSLSTLANTADNHDINLAKAENEERKLDLEAQKLAKQEAIDYYTAKWNKRFKIIGYVGKVGAFVASGAITLLSLGWDYDGHFTMSATKSAIKHSIDNFHRN